MTVISLFLPVKKRPIPKFRQNLELGGVSIGYVIATSEPADSQVSISSLLIFTKDKSQPWACWHLQKIGLDTCWHLQKTSITNFELGGFSTSYVIATSELADSQVSTLSLLTFTKDRSRYLLTFIKYKYHQLRAWWFLNQLYHRDLWTGR